MREDYTLGGLKREDLPGEPLPLFRTWFEQACEHGLPEPNAFGLSTVDAEGRPSARTVLLKAYDERGFVFYTSYESAKAGDIAANPSVSMLFAWLPLQRQVSIRGIAEKISTAESLRYFLSRPVGNRLGAWVSQQSKVIGSRQLLEAKWEQVKRKFAEGDVPMPEDWGGYRIIPESIEFWQGRLNRLHDRFLYRRADDAWRIERLQP